MTSSEPPSSSTPYKLLPSPITGKADWRKFKAFQLMDPSSSTTGDSDGKNHPQMTVLLVQDVESKTTAAAASVQVGAASDPIPGLAHFCEHMCFLGSQAYPLENEYKEYLSQHGGQSNASTSMHTTVYKFEVLAPYAPKALDIFAHFFTDPLFTESGTAREVQAVDSENSKNLVSDLRRRLQIFKDVVRREHATEDRDSPHYYQKFSTGNAQTLEHDNIRELLLAFHRKHYRPERLTVVVAGPQSIDELEQMVVPVFRSMKPQDWSVTNEIERIIEEAAQEAPPISILESPPSYRPPLQPNEKWPFLITTKPVRSVRKLVMSFPMPPVYFNPDRSPTSILSHLLGHEGPSSSFAVLQDANLITSLSAGCRVTAPDFTIFQLEVQLTESEEWRKVVDVIFQHARRLQNASVDELQRMWLEMIEMSRIFFDQTSPGSVYALAPKLAQNIISDGTEMCLAAGSRLKEDKNSFPLEQFREFAALLRPENCIIERCSDSAWNEMEEQENSTGVERKKEKWYGVDYFQADIVKSDVDRWAGRSDPPFFPNARLDLPRPNVFIPRNLELSEELLPEFRTGPHIEKKIEPPTLLLDESRAGRLWHRLDDRYALPKAVVTILIRNAAVEHEKNAGVWRADVSREVHSSLLASMFREALAQETYDADISGLSWNLSTSQQGIKLQCNGFSDKLSELVKKLLDDFLAGKFIQERYFQAGKDRLLRNLRLYFSSRRADSLALYYRDFLMCHSDGGIPAAVAATENCTLDSLKYHHQNLLQNEESSIDCLYTGNVSSSEARAVFEHVLLSYDNAAKLARKEEVPTLWVPGPIERVLKEGEEVHLHFQSQNEQEENGCVYMTYQSHIPGYHGVNGADAEESLQSTSAIRVLSHMLREPMFDELRTKQALGYIVSSYYDQGFSSRPPEDLSVAHYALPTDNIVINVLSRKLSPVQITERIDEFLVKFRKTLEDMPESEFTNHTHALSTKLRKPIQKLEQEASLHSTLIRRYGTQADWYLAEALADRMEKLKKQDILSAWDRLISPSSRSRVVSHVYGKTFPLVIDTEKIILNRTLTLWEKTFGKKTVIVNDLDSILRHRLRLGIVGPPQMNRRRPFLTKLRSSTTTTLAVATVGVGVFGLTLCWLWWGGNHPPLTPSSRSSSRTTRRSE